MTPQEALQTRFQMGPAGFFVLVGSQRSGTNFVREMLNTHPKLHVHGEVMWPSPHPAVWHNFLRTCSYRSQPAVLDADANQLLDDYLVHLSEDTRRGNPMKADSLSMIGVDIKYNQMRTAGPLIQDLNAPPFLFGYLRDRRIPLLHVFRRNLLHQALSLVIAESRGVYHNYGGRTFEGNLVVEPARVVERCYWIAEQRALFRQMSTGSEVYDLAYEDLAELCEGAPSEDKLEASSEVVAGLCGFLAVDADFRRPKSISKVINRPFHQILSNYEELKRAILVSEFHQFEGSI
ncbi:MAG: hypothetical protein RIT24_1763 [Planctomycetota bacterium]